MIGGAAKKLCDMLRLLVLAPWPLPPQLTPE